MYVLKSRGRQTGCEWVVVWWVLLDEEKRQEAVVDVTGGLVCLLSLAV